MLVITAAQLNRLSEGRKDHVPQLSELRESGAIEQDTDVITFLNRPEFYDRNVCLRTPKKWLLASPVIDTTKRAPQRPPLDRSLRTRKMKELLEPSKSTVVTTNVRAFSTKTSTAAPPTRFPVALNYLFFYSRRNTALMARNRAHTLPRRASE